MKPATGRKPPVRKAAAGRDYLALVKQFPLRPLRGEADYDRAAAILDSLVLRDLSDGERDYLDALTLIVEAYDDEHYPIEPDKRPPHERLRALMKHAGMSPTDLQRVLGVAQSTVSMVLAGRRSLSKTTINKLSHHFKLSPAYFL